MRIKLPTNEMSEMSRKDLDSVEKYADKVMNPVDIEFTHHFLDRLTHPRNKKEITKAELIGFFKRLSKNKKKFLNFLRKYKEFVVNDDRYKLNIPFVKAANQLVAKTIMRKDNFKTPDPKWKFENYHTYLKENYNKTK